MKDKYILGVLDCEGGFYPLLHKNGRGERHPTMRIIVTTTRKGIVDKLIECLKGSQSQQKLKSGKILYRWVLQGKKAEQLGYDLRRYMSEGLLNQYNKALNKMDLMRKNR